MRPIGLIFAGMFAIFAGIAWFTLRGMLRDSVDDVFDLMFLLFQGFWLLGWSVAVLILGLLTVFFFFYAESVRLEDRRLVHAPGLGPLKILVEYELARIQGVRIEEASDKGAVRVRFDYEGRRCTIGDGMTRANANLLLDEVRRAGAGLASTVEAPIAPAPMRAWSPATAPARPSEDVAPPALTSPSGIALIVANLAPLAGVLFFGWDLASIVVLFWAESGVIGFYTALKMVVVGKLAAIVAVPFFVGHFGGFMAGHFLLIYALFVRGVTATGPAPAVREAMLHIFNPLWFPLAGLFISHGISFFDNFLGRREYQGASMKELMTAPYGRIVVMQLALIFGGWIVLLLKNPVPALALLILLKTALDFSAHRKEHGES